MSEIIGRILNEPGNREKIEGLKKDISSGEEYSGWYAEDTEEIEKLIDAIKEVDHAEALILNREFERLKKRFEADYEKFKKAEETLKNTEGLEDLHKMELGIAQEELKQSEERLQEFKKRINVEKATDTK